MLWKTHLCSQKGPASQRSVALHNIAVLQNMKYLQWKDRNKLPAWTPIIFQFLWHWNHKRMSSQEVIGIKQKSETERANQPKRGNKISHEMIRASQVCNAGKHLFALWKVLRDKIKWESGWFINSGWQRWVLIFNSLLNQFAIFPEGRFQCEPV